MNIILVASFTSSTYLKSVPVFLSAMEEEYEETYETNDTDAFTNVAQGLSGENKAALVDYWQQAIDNIERIGEDASAVSAFKSTALPLARIKKVMKTDSEVCMISAEAPILFAKGCDIFITELTMRAWIHAEESKRRTLQRSDIANALQKSDMFDFLIDIVPREEAHTRRYAPPSASSSAVPPHDMSTAGPSSGIVDLQQSGQDGPHALQSLPAELVAEVPGGEMPGVPQGVAASSNDPAAAGIQEHVGRATHHASDGAGTNVHIASRAASRPSVGSEHHDKYNESLDDKNLPPESESKLANGADFEEEFQYQYNDGSPVYPAVDVGFRGF